MKVMEEDDVAQFSFSFSMSSRRCFLRQSMLWLSFIAAYVVICFMVAGSSVYDREVVGDYYGPEDACYFLLSFPFRSTLMGFFEEEDDSVWLSNSFDQASISASLEMMNGEIVSCSIRNSAGQIFYQQISGNRGINMKEINFCENCYLLNLWIKNSSNDYLEIEGEVSFINSSISSEIEKSPPFLEWRRFTVYSPSYQILRVANKHNECLLTIFDLYRTNTQFNPYTFQKISLSPGQSASVPLIFLPRLLGLSLAELLLQTNLSIYDSYKEVLNDFKINHSADVLCSINQQKGIQVALYAYSGRSSPKSRKLGSSRLDIWPHLRWNVPQSSYVAVIELNLWCHLSRMVSRSVCMKLSKYLQKDSETISLPINIEMRDRDSYTDSLIPCHGIKTVFSILLRNDASYLVRFEKISEETSGSKIFIMKFMEGLLLFPGKVTHIALITYSHALCPEDIFNLGLNCMLIVRTNDSIRPEISIPCYDLVLNSCKCQNGFHTFESEGSYINLMSKLENEKRSSNLEFANEESLQFKPKITGVIELDDLLIHNWKSHAAMNAISVLQDKEIIFPVVQLGSHYSKWISVYNPSHKSVVMQLVLNSGAIIDRCKSSNKLSEYAFLAKNLNFDSAEIKFGFSVAKSAITEAIVHPLKRALFGPVVFHPSNRCMWQSSVLIRNNLSGLEQLPLLAFGGSQSITILEGSASILKLDFDIHSLYAINLSMEKSTRLCSDSFSKVLYAKNTGELPLKVLKLRVSGVDCGADGFTIHNCEGFILAPGESTNLCISYRTDLSASVVFRDFELTMDTGVLVIPMRASVPDYILNMCRKALFMHWKKLYLFFLFAFAVILHFMFQFATPPSNAEASSVLCQESQNSSSRDGKKSTERCSDHHKQAIISRNSTNDGHLEAASPTQPFGLLQSCNLTVRVAREKGRRRKKRPNRAGLAAKLDISSSQSGNSTPSSPMSPNSFNPKNVLPHYYEPAYLHPQKIEEPKRHGYEALNQERKAESARSYDTKWPSSHQGLLPSLSTKFSKKFTLLPSATFPGPGWRSPTISALSFLASSSPIAPCARAPGSKLCKEGEGSDTVIKDYTYDIWGNHFSEGVFRLSKESNAKVLDFWEDDSNSFFSKDLQSPKMISPSLVSSGTSTDLELSL